MKVLILGATGFIGFPVAQAFSRAGHIVYGTTRDPKAAKQLLAANEILPLVCTASTERGRAVWGKIAADVDVIIDTIPTLGYEAPLGTFKHVENVVVAVDGERGQRPGTKITYIYTGGSWVHSLGAGGLETWTSEQQPHTGRNTSTAWRWEVEKHVLASDKVNGIVIRPSVLYGRSGSMFDMFVLAPAYDAAKSRDKTSPQAHGHEHDPTLAKDTSHAALFDAVGYPDTRLILVHQDDLADLYLRAAERGPLLKGQALVGANSQSERLTDILDAAVRVSGAKGYNLRPPSPHNAFEEAWSSTTNLRPTLGSSLTGWTPRKAGLVDGMDVYWEAFVAHYEGKRNIPAWAAPACTKSCSDTTW